MNGQVRLKMWEAWLCSFVAKQERTYLVPFTLLMAGDSVSSLLRTRCAHFQCMTVTYTRITEPGLGVYYDVYWSRLYVEMREYAYRMYYVFFYNKTLDGLLLECCSLDARRSSNSPELGKHIELEILRITRATQDISAV